MKGMNDAVGNLLKSLRERQCLAQEELGSRIGMTQSQVCLIERNGTDRISVIKVFAQYYGIHWIEMCRMAEETEVDNELGITVKQWSHGSHQGRLEKVIKEDLN